MMLVSGTGLTPPRPLLAKSPPSANRKSVTPARMRTPTMLAVPQAATSSSAPERATGSNTLQQAHLTTTFTPPFRTLGYSSSSYNSEHIMHPSSNGTRLRDSKRPLLQRRINNNSAAYHHPVGTAASTFSSNNAVSAKDTSAFPMNTLAQKSDYKLSTSSQEPRSSAQSYVRQSGGAAMASAKPDAGGGAFTFRVSGKPNAASNNAHRADMPVSPPQPARLVIGSPVRGGKQRAATAAAGFGAVTDASARLAGMSRRPSAGQGFLMSGPVVSIDECSERLERLLQRVHNANKEHDAFKALMSPRAPMTPTRLDPTPPPTPPAHTSSTVSTVSFGADSNHSATDLPITTRCGSGMAGTSISNNNNNNEAADPYSPRRRAMTVDHHLSSAKRNQNASPGIRNRLEELRARRLAREEDERKATAEDGRAASPTPSPTAAIRARAEELRARRLAREEEEYRAALNPTSPMYSPPLAGSKPRANTDYVSAGGMYSNISISGPETAIEYAAGADGDVDFFDNKDVIAMFREIPLPFKELDWEKQVHYYHVARTNDAYRKATEDVELRDCRAECLVDILGEKTAARVVAKESKRGKEQLVLRRQRGSENDVVHGASDISDLALRSTGTEEEDVMSLLDSDFEDDDEAERSFDWSRDGFGYMEFRRMSRMSLGKPSVLSPVGGGSGARALGNDAHDGVSPLSRPLPKQKQQQKQSPLHNLVPTPAMASSYRLGNSPTADMQSTSLLHATASNSAEPPSPVTARAAADKFSEAITPRVLRRSNSKTGSSSSSSSRIRAGSGDASGGGGGSGKELLARMRGSVDRMVPQRWRGGTLVNSGQTSKLRRDSNHALSLIKESDVAAESDDEWQVLSHVANLSTLTPEQQLAQLIAENQQLRTHVSQARKAIDALTRVVVRMQ